MVLLTLNYVPGREIDALGMVKGNVVQSKNIGKDLLAGFKNIAGGEIKSYTEMLAEARHIATMRMINEAEGQWEQMLLSACDSHLLLLWTEQLRSSPMEQR